MNMRNDLGFRMFDFGFNRQPINLLNSTFNNSEIEHPKSELKKHFDLKNICLYLRQLIHSFTI